MMQLSLRPGGGASVFLFGGDGRTRVGLAARPEATNQVFVAGEAGSVLLDVSERGRQTFHGDPRIQLLDPGQRVLTTLSLDEERNPHLQFWDRTLLQRIALGCDAESPRGPSSCFLKILDENEKPVAELP